MTYPDQTIADTINGHFVAVQINTREEAGQPVVERYHQVWTPDIRVLDASGFELYRWNGYLPPSEFLPQLLVGHAQALLRLHDEPGAAALYDDVLRRFPTSAVAPEACYYLAIARYKASGDNAKLRSGWEQLRSRYPTSTWRLKQSFMENESKA